MRDAVVHIQAELSQKLVRVCCLLMALAGSAVRAQESASYLEAADHGPLLAYASLPSGASISLLDRAVQPDLALARAKDEPPVSLWTAPVPDLAISDAPLHLDDDHFRAIFHSSATASILDDDDLVIARAQLPSRFAYHSMARLETGYGQYLGPDTVGRWRTNGAGLEELDYLYVKLNFRF